jgi:WXG100 family type VII secretion target
MSDFGDDSLILVQYASLQEANANVQSAVNFMNQQLDQLKTYLAQLKELWEGDAGTAYKALQAKWDQTALDLNQVLAKVPPELQQAQQAYQATESKNAGVWT